MDIGNKLRIIRESRNLSVYRVSADTYISENSIRKLENNITEPKLSTLKILLSYYGISLSDFFNTSEDIEYLSDEEKELLEHFRLMPEDRRGYIINITKETKKLK